MVMAVAMAMRMGVRVLMAVFVAVFVAGGVTVLMVMLLAVGVVVFMVSMLVLMLKVVMGWADIVVGIIMGAVDVAGKVTMMPTAVVPQSIRMLRASAIPVTKSCLLLIGLHATAVHGSGPTGAASACQCPMLGGDQPGLHCKPGNCAFCQRHLLTGNARGEGTATVWYPAAASTLMLHSWPSLSFCMDRAVRIPDLAVAMPVRERSASTTSTEQLGQWPLKHAVGNWSPQRRAAE